MSRATRSARQTPQSPDRLDDIFDPMRSADNVEDLLMQQALLEAVSGVRTPTSPAFSRRSGRSSIAPPAYDPAHPNAQGDAIPYDPGAWSAVSEVGSYHANRRSSTPPSNRLGARYSPTAPVYNPYSRSQREAQQYDPSAPIPGGRYNDFRDLPGVARRALSVVAGGEPSPGYSQYGGYGAARHSPTTGSVAVRLDGFAETLDQFQRHVDSRMDRIEAQLTMISDALSDQMNGTKTPDTASSGSKRKRPSPKKVSFDTSGSDTSFSPSDSDNDNNLFSSSDSAGDDDDDTEEDNEQSSPPKKPKISVQSPTSPRTPPNRGSPSPSNSARGKASGRPAPSTPRQQIDAAVHSTPAAPRNGKAAARSPVTRTPRTPPHQSTPAVPATPAAPRKKRSGNLKTATTPTPAHSIPQTRSSARIRAQVAATKPH